jgi:hypothetical protein
MTQVLYWLSGLSAAICLVNFAGTWGDQDSAIQQLALAAQTLVWIVGPYCLARMVHEGVRAAKEKSALGPVAASTTASPEEVADARGKHQAKAIFSGLD